MVCAKFDVPSDALRAVFTPDVLTRLRARKQPSEQLTWRLEVLDACGPAPTDPWRARKVRVWRARKAVWEAYLTASYASGLFDGHAGSDLRARLTIDDDGKFRGAMAECMACWFLSCSIGSPVERVPQSTNGRTRDFQVHFPFGDAGLEVKAPARERQQGFHWVDDSDVLRKCLKTANQQFSADCPNVLVIAPNLECPLFYDRQTLVRAFYVRRAIVCDFNPAKARLENPRSEFRRTGAFLNRTEPSGKPLKADGAPAYRRVSAIVCIEETLCGDETRITHNVMILHNPHANHPIPEAVWGEYPQLVKRERLMVWTDG